VLAALALVGPADAARDPETAAAWPAGTAVVSYESERAFAAALVRHPATVVRRIGALRVAAVRPRGDVGAYAARLASEPGIARVGRATARRSLAEPALALDATALPFQWQYAAVGADRVPADVAAAAARITIAVVDTGVDAGAPDLASKRLVTHSIRGGDATDANGHGTFVAALAAGSSTNGEGVAGVAGEAGLMVVRAGLPNGSFTDVDEAAAIVWAVDHGARIVNLSLGGAGSSELERRAVEYAASKGVLLVAAVGNGRLRGNAVEYPAALLQPVGSRGVGGYGLSVAASAPDGSRAPFSSTGSHVSLAAPGLGVFSAVSSASSASQYPRTPLPGSLAGLYGYGSGTSFAAPQVAGAAALVWAANPALRATDVATILEETAGGLGSWSPELGFGVVDVARAVERARTATPTAVSLAPAASSDALRVRATRTGPRVTLSWQAVPGARRYVVSLGGRALGSVARTSFLASLPHGTHSLTVTAVGPGGVELAASRPLRVQIPKAL
jgi:subtilisin family serine protease